MANELVFGQIEGSPVGSTFANYGEMNAAGVHRPTQAGIGGSWKSGGADSIIVSGGYEDDLDLGHEIIYTGHGGKGSSSSVQIADQSVDASGNRALAYNALSGYPVRVIRGAGGEPEHSPKAGYRYDGLYAVEESWVERGRSGFQIVRFRLRQLGAAATKAFEEPPGVDDPPLGKTSPGKKEQTTTRVVRDSAVSRWVKKRHKYACQMCGEVLDTPIGPYAEGAHIRPLGKPHNGPDTAANVLCLCPNHHVLFDKGAVAVTDGGTLIGRRGTLRSARGHKPAVEHLAYHRGIHGFE